MTESITALSADRPSTDPGQDLFGHAPFARTLATAIRGFQGSDGIVLALYGPWGSGKSTVLAYVQHELEQGQEEDRPAVVLFNPWWFSGQEHLAKAFLGQLQVVLPTKYEKFRAFGDKLAEFSDALGGVGDVVGAATGHGWLGGVLRRGTKLAGRAPKDVPAMKKELSDLLLDQKKRVLVIIDDIDRLAPDEIRQLFTVIKALADFPYVTYLLAFDRDVATQAISEQTGLPGDRYLEKIIQVPFELPRSERTSLQQALFTRLDEIMAPTPEGRFDKMHWSNVFHSGLDPLITVPRDVVRLVNALSVTYPPVVGEVNPVDFIAIEALRVFLPSVYDAIRTTPEEFVGYANLSRYDRNETKQRAQAFHQGWLNTVPESLRERIKDMVERLFPRLESVWSNMNYGSDAASVWRRDLRVCAPEIFPTYFRLSLPAEAVSRFDIDALLAAMQSPGTFGEALLAASTLKDVRGVSKVRTLLERFMDHIEGDVGSEDVEPILDALMEVGDKLLKADRNSQSFDFGNESRIGRIAYHLLKKVAPEERAPLLTRKMGQANALRCSQYLIASLIQEAGKAGGGGREPLVAAADVDDLKTSWCERVAQLAADADFIDHPSVAWLLSGWREWGDPAKAVAWWQAASVNDETLLKLISAQSSEVRTQSGSDVAYRTHLRVNPKGFEPYGDVQALSERVQTLIVRNAVSEPYLAAAKEFVRECDAMKAGKDPDDFGFFDD
jgi:predicted KAP-like P-loop ATPase